MPAASSGTAWVWGGGPQDTRWDASFSPAAFLRSSHSLQLQKGPVPHPAGKPGPAPHLHHGPEQHRLRPRELHRRRGPRPALQLSGRAGRPGHGRAHPGVGSGATPGQPQAPYTHHQDHSWQGGAAEPGAAAEVAAVHWGAGRQDEAPKQAQALAGGDGLTFSLVCSVPGHRQNPYNQSRPTPLSLVVEPSPLLVASTMPLTSWVSFLVGSDCLCRICPLAWGSDSAHPSAWGELVSLV